MISHTDKEFVINTGFKDHKKIHKEIISTKTNNIGFANCFGFGNWIFIIKNSLDYSYLEVFNIMLRKKMMSYDVTKLFSGETFSKNFDPILGSNIQKNQFGNEPIQERMINRDRPFSATFDNLKEKPLETNETPSFMIKKLLGIEATTRKSQMIMLFQAREKHSQDQIFNILVRSPANNIKINYYKTFRAVTDFVNWVEYLKHSKVSDALYIAYSKGYNVITVVDGGEESKFELWYQLFPYPYSNIIERIEVSEDEEAITLWEASGSEFCAFFFDKRFPQAVE